MALAAICVDMRGSQSSGSWSFASERLIAISQNEAMLKQAGFVASCMASNALLLNFGFCSSAQIRA